MKIKNITTVALLAASVALASCSKWTDQESLNVVQPGIAEQNAALYQQYLTNLRGYKRTDHQLLMGWFDNSVAVPNSRASSLSSLPDSVDVVSLMVPYGLTDVVKKDMASIQKDKATKVIYTIDYEAFNDSIRTAIADAATAGTPITVDFNATLSAWMDSRLALMDKYGYDGVSINYEGYSTEALTAAQIASLQAVQDIIFGKLAAARQAAPAKLFVFEGKPEFVLGRSAILPMYNYIVLKTWSQLSLSDMERIVNMSVLVSGVPMNNIIITTIPLPLHKDDDVRGYFLSTDGSKYYSQITETANWMLQPASYTKAGMGIYRINDDYYYPIFTIEGASSNQMDYMFTRTAIATMNPSPKK